MPASPPPEPATAMNALLLILICITAGALAVRVSHPDGLVGALNWWVLYIALPALVLDQASRLQWAMDLLFPALAMWLVFLGAWVVLAGIGRWRGWSRGQIGALVLTCGLGNTAFIGFPLIEALRGQQALGGAVIADQLGSFMVLSTLGIFVATYYAGHRLDPRRLVRQVLLFPAFIALMVATLARLAGGLPAPLAEVVGRLGLTLVPLALFSVGMQLRLRAPGHDLGPMLCGLGWKLIAAPAMIWAVVLLLGMRGEVVQIAILQAGMAPMISAGILAQQHGLAPALASRVVGLGILASLVSVPLLDQLLRL